MPTSTISPLPAPTAPDLGGVAADEPMTETQAARLRALCDRAGEPFDAALTQRQAQKRIAALEEIEGA